MKNIDVKILLLIFVVSTFIKVFAVSGNNFPFTMDQGRDMVDIRQMVVSQTPRLVGPTTSINGVLLGPFWYYFLLPPFLATGGNPQALMYWQIIWYQLSIVFLWWVLKGLNNKLAFFAAFFLLLSPTGFYTSRYFWNANAMPMMTAFFFGFFILAIRKPSLLNLTLTGLVAGLSMQIEAAFGVLFFPFAFLYLAIKNRKLKQLFILSLGFGATLLPQVLFEIRHKFIMTKVLLSELRGEAAILGEKLSLDEKLSERWKYLIDQVRNLSHIPESYTNLIFVASLIVVIYLVLKRNKKSFNFNKDVAIISLTFFIFTSLFYMIFPQHLKQWYVLGISIPLTLIIVYTLNYLWETQNKFAMLLVSVILLFHFLNAITAQVEYIQNNTLKPSNDPSNLRNQIQVITEVYQEAKGESFKAYNYIPSVYDYSLNYLYWWYGTQKFGYQPSDVAYLPNQPEYIPGNKLLWTKTKSSQEREPTFLIIEIDKEMPSREDAWMGNFQHLCPQKLFTYPFGVRVEKRGPCIL